MELENRPSPRITYEHIILHGIASVVNSIPYLPLFPTNLKDVTVQITQKLEGEVSLAHRTQKSFRLLHRGSGWKNPRPSNQLLTRS